MDFSYDEDISKNPFFMELQTEHPELFRQCIAEGWVICVPRNNLITSQIFTLQDLLGHILVRNDDLPSTHFMSLTDKTVRVINRVISVEQNHNGLPSEIHILFEETFYTTDKMKYIVWCIEFPLELECSSISQNIVLSQCKPLCSLRDCIDFLWTESTGKEVLENMDTEIKCCKKELMEMQGASLYKLKDMVSSLFTKCVQTALKNRRLKEKCKSCKNSMNNVKLSVETYILHGIYNELFEVLSVCTAYEDSNLNKLIRNLADVQLCDLKVKQEFIICLPVAKKNLSLIQSYSTILGKVSCLKNTMSALNKNNTTQSSNFYLYVSIDESLPILIFLVLKSGVANWLTHLNFLKHFRFSVHQFLESDEFSFYISTLEAAIEQIKLGLFSSCPLPESQKTFDDSDESFELVEVSNEKSLAKEVNDNKCASNLHHLFEHVKLSSTEKVREILEQNKAILASQEDLDYLNPLNMSNLSLEDVLNEEDPVNSTMCHPLCTCIKCSKVYSRNLLKSSPTVFSRDTHGFTVLHMAVLYNRPRIVDLVLELGADPDSADCSGSTPLHYAASKGHQTAMLLLLYVGADFNKQNMDKNTPLHLACNNGHENCVKALIYYCEQSRGDLNLQAVNENGDTPLHLASKWGYQSIVYVLLQNGAEPWIKNSKGKTPIDHAHSRMISNLLLSASPNLFEYVNVSIDSNNKRPQIKSDVVLLDLNDVPASHQCTNSCVSNEAIKPKSTNDIHNVERLFRSIAYGDVKLACFYMNIDYDSNVNSDVLNENVNKENDTNLCHPLCSCSKCSGCKLIDFNINCNVNVCDSKGDTPLHVAVKHNRLEICDILLKNSAIPDIKNNVGQIPLHIAAKDNKVDIMRRILKHVKSSRAIDSSGNTPLHLACRNGSIEAVKLLLDFEPYVEIRNTAHKTPLDEAKDEVHLTIIYLLEENNEQLS